MVWLRYRRALPLESVSRFRLVSVTVFDQAAANSSDAFLKDDFALAQSAALAVSSLAAASLVLLQFVRRFRGPLSANLQSNEEGPFWRQVEEHQGPRQSARHPLPGIPRGA
jgi:hypothetical protein